MLCLSHIRRALLFTALLFFIAPAFAQQGRLKLHISGIEPGLGNMQVALYNKKENFPDPQLTYTGRVVKPDATSDQLNIIFDNLPKGAYAAAVFQDINKNGKLDTNAMGIPTEPYGFSNNPRVKWSGPKYESAVFEIKEKELALDILVKRWKSW